MVALKQLPKSIAAQGLNALFKMRGVLIVLLTIGIGALLGFLLSSPLPEVVETTASMVVIFAVMFIIINEPLQGVLVWLLLVTFLETWVLLPMGAGLPDLSFSRFIIAFLGIFMLAKAAIGEFRFQRISLTDLCILGVTVGLISSSPLAVNPKGMIQNTISLFLIPMCIYFFTKNLVKNRRELHLLLGVIVLFGSIAAIYAIYESVTGNILFLSKADVDKVLRTDYTENLRLLQGLVGSSGNFGRVFVSTIPITFYLLFESEGINKKILLVGLIVIQFISIFLTYNRTSYYTLLITLTIIQFFYPQFRRLYLIIVFVALVTLWIAWDQVSDSAVVNERINSKVSTLEGREARWKAGFNMWKAKPIRGWGLDRYQTESGRYRTDGVKRNFENGAIENDYLKILISGGLVGFVPYFLFLVTPLINSLRLFFKTRAPNWAGFIKRETIIIYWAVIIAFAITSYTQVQNSEIVKMIPFALAGAVIGSHESLLHRRKSEELIPSS